jgi:hypothetical protein
VTPSLCEDVFWRLPHLIYPSLSARASCQFLETRMISKRIANCHQGFILPQIKEQNKRTDNRHDETGGVI